MKSIELIKGLYPGRASLRLDEAARVLGVRPSTLYQWRFYDKSPVPIRRAGGALVVPVAAIAAFLDEGGKA